jgi:pimeloyl-ACP methyl ester carboxylesterase
MKLASRRLPRLQLVTGLFLFVSWFTTAVNAQIQSRFADVDGAKLHYLVAGKGEALILLHGYAQTSRMWRKAMPRFAERFQVIAPDLPGIGDSSIPASGLDMKSAAIRIHQLAQSLGIKKARVVGHDIGLMVAYAYAAMYPTEVEKLIVMDAFLPGVEGWEAIYNSPDYWHFRFHGPTPEKLVRGRESTYFAYFWNDLAADKNHSVSAENRAAYIANYSKPGRMRAAWAYFASWPQTAKEFAEMAKTKLTMPVLAIGGDKSLGVPLGVQMKLVADNVKIVIVKDSGHWILDEQPQQTIQALIDFL